MTEETVMRQLSSVGIPIEPDFAVPVNGVTKQLPYMVARSKSEVKGSDNGRVLYQTTKWLVALFCGNKRPDLERKTLLALAGVGQVEVESFPDGSPYQTNFEFETRQILK